MLPPGRERLATSPLPTRSLAPPAMTLPLPILVFIQRRFPTYQFRYSKTAEARYYANLRRNADDVFGLRYIWSDQRDRRHVCPATPTGRHRAREIQRWMDFYYFIRHESHTSDLGGRLSLVTNHVNVGACVLARHIYGKAPPGPPTRGGEDPGCWSVN